MRVVGTNVVLQLFLCFDVDVSLVVSGAVKWSIPQTWRTKLNLDGYVPTSFTKARLITECEILERNEPQKPTKVLTKQKEKPYEKGASSK